MEKTFTYSFVNTKVIPFLGDRGQFAVFVKFAVDFNTSDPLKIKCHT